jgi:hypothetical protein
MTNTNTSEREETSMAFTPGPWEVDMLSEVSAEIRPVDEFTVIARVTRIDTATNAKLIAAAPELYEALGPFGDIDGEGDEDFPDEAKVTVSFGRSTNYTLTLGDFRRARAALSKVST